MSNEIENIPQNTNVQEKIDEQNVEKKLETSEQTNSEPTKEDPNWKAFREARKKDRADKEAAEKRASEKEAEAAALKAAMEAAFSNQPNNYQNNRNSYENEESEDERIDRRVHEALAKKEAEFERAMQQREIQEYPQRLVKNYSDFNQTVATENLDYLEYHYPEVAAPLKRLPDGYDKWADIYRAVKKFVPDHGSAKKQAQKADENFNKPKSMSSVNLTQSGEPAGNARISEERKADNWKRMQKMLKSV